MRIKAFLSYQDEQVRTIQKFNNWHHCFELKLRRWIEPTPTPTPTPTLTTFPWTRQFASKNRRGCLQSVCCRNSNPSEISCKRIRQIRTSLSRLFSSTTSSTCLCFQIFIKPKKLWTCDHSHFNGTLNSFFQSKTFDTRIERWYVYFYSIKFT